MKRWTLKSLADELGVSIATMSNAYNRPDQLSDSLRERLLMNAAALGYNGPSAAASSLRTGKTGVIGIMLSHPLSYGFSDPLAGLFLEGFSSVLEARNMSLLVLSSRAEYESLASYVSLVDGFVMYGPPLQSVLDFMARQPKPMITVDFKIDGVNSLTVNDYEGCYNIAKYCVRSGDSVAVMGLRLIDDNQITTIEGRDLFDHHFITIKRLQGFRDGAMMNGVIIKDSSVWHVPENLHALARKAAEQVLTSADLPDVILCQSDRIGLAVIQVARELGLNVPKDVRVTGFDDIPEAARNIPGLTTVAQQSYAKGVTAAEMLLGDRPNESVVLETQIQLRMSSFLPKQR